MYAIVKAGGRQHRVTPGAVVVIDGTAGQPGTGQPGAEDQPGAGDQPGTAGAAAGNTTDRAPVTAQADAAPGSTVDRASDAAQAGGDLGDWNDQDEGGHAGSGPGSGGSAWYV